MALPRTLYLCALLGCSCFYLACGEWFSWVLLLAVAGFPWLSLLLSLRAIMGFSAAPEGPETLLIGTRAELWLSGRCSLPIPPFRGSLRLHNQSTGEQKRYDSIRGIPTAHCGSYTVTVEKAKIYDYLGLFCFSVRKKETKTLQILPRPLPLDHSPLLPNCQTTKPVLSSHSSGENHELRPYRPGDQLSRIHWKLSAKTGSLIFREMFESRPNPVLVTMTLEGTPAERDRKLGRFFWLGNKILQNQLCFDLQVLTGAGLRTFAVQNLSDLNNTLTVLLSSPITKAGNCINLNIGNRWHCHIGGAPDDQT